MTALLPIRNCEGAANIPEKAEGRRQKAEGRKQKAESRKQKWSPIPSCQLLPSDF
jgi:hypothetical protein